MEKLYLLEQMAHMGKRKYFRFHTPGHNANKKFSKYFKDAKNDFASLPFADKIAQPKARLKKAQENSAKILGAKETFYMTDGVRMAIYAMLHSVKDFGNSIIINRNAPAYVYDALKILQIEPIILNQNIKEGKMLPPSTDELSKVLMQNKKCIGALLTYVDCYGLTFNMAEFRQKINSQGKLLLTDNCNGGHFRFYDNDKYAGKYSDIWVDGSYLTMPTLTQGVVLNVGNADLIDSVSKSVNLFRSEQVSYSILSSIEYGINYMNEEGFLKLEKLSGEILLLRQRLQAKNLPVVKSDDLFKIVVDFKPCKIDPKIVERYLQSKGVFAEMNDGRHLTFAISSVISNLSFMSFEYYLNIVVQSKKNKNTYKDRPHLTLGTKTKSYVQMCNKEMVEKVNLNSAVNRIASSNVCLKVPHIPIVVAGNLFTQEVIDGLNKQIGVFNIEDNKVEVIRERNEG